MPLPSWWFSNFVEAGNQMATAKDVENSFIFRKNITPSGSDIITPWHQYSVKQLAIIPLLEIIATNFMTWNDK
jgi:hypothetical protein